MALDAAAQGEPLRRNDVYVFKGKGNPRKFDEIYLQLKSRQIQNDGAEQHSSQKDLVRACMRCVCAVVCAAVYVYYLSEFI